MTLTLNVNINPKVEKVLGRAGRTLNGKVKGHEIYRNSCVFTEDGTQVWFGDIDFTSGEEKLLEAAKTLGERLYVTPELPFRNEGLIAANYSRRDAETVKVYEP